jgi:hypothetical protein
MIQRRLFPLLIPDKHQHPAAAHPRGGPVLGVIPDEIDAGVAAADAAEDAARASVAPRTPTAHQLTREFPSRSTVIHE